MRLGVWSNMKKVLFMPFLQIPSGHHQVADSLITGIKDIDPSIYCEKVDILHYGYGPIEKIVSKVYLKWIAHLPEVYSWIYRKSVCGEAKEEAQYKHYELLFLRVMRKIVSAKKPDLIVCTHALPSYMLSKLKQKGLLSTPVMNVYTDFFINDLWGVKGIDGHFVPSIRMKEYLLEKGVKEESIHVTGIPIHPTFLREMGTIVNVKERNDNVRNFLVTGGNLGVGQMEKLVKKMQRGDIKYSVLCGRNEKLYKRLKRLNRPNIKPIPFINKREEMDRIYSTSDGIIMKPGGVTVSESLFKRLPIFVYHTLPGQEEMNLAQLKHLGIAYHLREWEEKDFEQELISFYHNSNAQIQYNEGLNRYHANIEHHNPAEIIYRALM
jgi:processive 1,2-diacylglycerol beta-glucosyltransferase